MAAEFVLRLTLKEMGNKLMFMFHNIFGKSIKKIISGFFFIFQTYLAKIWRLLHGKDQSFSLCGLFPPAFIPLHIFSDTVKEERCLQMM